MPYVFGIPYVANSFMDGDDVNTNNEALRKYLNKDIVSADIADGSVGSPEIVKGEPQFVTSDHQFTCGSEANQFTPGEDIQRDYFTAHIKPTLALADDLWWALPNVGKKVHLERDGYILIHAGIEVISDLNFAMDYDNDGSVNNDGEGSDLRISINGDRKEVTYMLSFEEEAGSPTPSQSHAAIAKRRWYPISYLTETLAAGDHDITFVVNPVVDMGSIRSRNVSYEVFYI